MHRRDRENSLTQWKFDIAEFEIWNDFIKAVSDSAEETKEKVRDNGDSRYG